MRFEIQLSATRNYFLGFATSGILLFSGLFYFNGKETPTYLHSDIEYIETEKIVLHDFNPNDLDENGWKNMGFSQKQVATILKYKEIVGGKFSSKEQLKKCYAISGEKYEELRNYILLPETSKNNFSGKYSYLSSYKDTHKKELKIPGKFNPDNYSSADFVKLGFSENQANAILKYKNYLGGSFISKEKFKDCFIINEENYLKLSPYLLLPEKTPENFKSKFNSGLQSKKSDKINYENFDPNMTDFEGWKKLGFSEKQSQVIVNYRDKNLKGSFRTLEDIEKCFVISAEKFEEIKPFIKINPENFKTNTSQNTTPSNPTPKNDYSTETKTDFTKIDLNKITFRQLIEYGFDEKSAASYIGFRNKLGGFVNKNQILETYNIDKILIQRLVYAAPLHTEDIQKYTLIDAPESWLKNHPYFKYHADKIIYFRISFPDQKKIFKKMNVKPETEEKMKLYLK